VRICTEATLGDKRPPVCTGCGHEIDVDCCWCGNEREAHGHHLSGHDFRPMGCVCGFSDEAVPPRRPLAGAPTLPIGERTSAIARVEDHGHHLVVAMYRFHDGTERPSVEVHGSHDSAGPARVLPLPEAVHLMQNVSLDELHSIGGREVGVLYDADTTPATGATQKGGQG